MIQAEGWVCSNPECAQPNPQPLSEFLYRPITGTRFKECSTCRKAKLRANQKRRVEARIAFKKARSLESEEKK